MSVLRGSITKAGAVVLALLLGSCRGSAPRAPVLGEAYVGPASLALRSDIPTQSPTVVTVKHGDKLEILQQRRSFLRVRAPNGAEGWTEQRQLLAREDMTALQTLAKRAAAMPSQGRATTDADLRVHTLPAARSPSFLTLKENDKVDVLTHIRRNRADPPRKPLVAPPPKKTKSTRRKASKAPPYPPPPMPAPPAPPPNWLDLSKTGAPDDTAPENENPAPPEPTDDWSLVRTAGGQAGWVLTRRLRMAIPDEVAQYAEGRRIVSYFSLGSVRDGDQEKDIWLWTTIGGGTPPYDFDSFRVFVWSVRRHRYETEYIERNLTGYEPVEVQPVRFSAGKGRNAPSGEQYPGFSVCIEKKDGQRYRREYAVLNTVVRFSGEQPCETPPPVDFGAAPAAPPAAATPQSPAAGFAERVKRKLKSWFGR